MPTDGSADAAVVLVVNAGSSSLKYQLLRPATGQVLAKGLVERIGEGPVADHAAAFEHMLATFEQDGPDLSDLHLAAVGHRVVHGGAHLREPALVDDRLLAEVERLVPLAPLHNPGNLEGMRTALRVFPGVPQVAVFDTAFHATLPEPAYTYAVPLAWRDEHRIRRYGFHGTSHAFVSRRLAELLGRPVEQVSSIVLHLGNGASACAVQGGRSVETSMGLTPLEGLVMGTRPGDLDPGLQAHLSRTLGMDAAEVDRALSKEAGLKGLTGENDMRAIVERADRGDAAARLAIDVTIHRIVKYVGAYAAVLGRLDALAFTGGIGENDDALRARVLQALTILDVRLDPAANADRAAGDRCITSEGSRVSAWVVATNEELEIARQAAALVGR